MALSRSTRLATLFATLGTIVSWLIFFQVRLGKPAFRITLCPSCDCAQAGISSRISRNSPESLSGVPSRGNPHTQSRYCWARCSLDCGLHGVSEGSFCHHSDRSNRLPISDTSSAPACVLYCQSANSSLLNGSREVQPIGQFISHSTQSGFSCPPRSSSGKCAIIFRLPLPPHSSIRPI